MTDVSEKQQRYRQFLDLLPLTLALAGLARAPASKSFSTDQLEARGMSIRNAFKVARQVTREAIGGEGVASAGRRA